MASPIPRLLPVTRQLLPFRSPSFDEEEKEEEEEEEEVEEEGGRFSSHRDMAAVVSVAAVAVEDVPTFIMNSCPVINAASGRRRKAKGQATRARESGEGEREKGEERKEVDNDEVEWKDPRIFTMLTLVPVGPISLANDRTSDASPEDKEVDMTSPGICEERSTIRPCLSLRAARGWRTCIANVETSAGERTHVVSTSTLELDGPLSFAPSF